MKKTLLLLSLITIAIGGAFAQGACTPDSTHFASGKYIYPDSLPCITKGQAYSGQVSLHVPDSLDAHLFTALVPANTYYVHLDSLRIDSVTGMPSGISAATNPVNGVWIHGGEYGCALFAGTTTAAVGNYPVSIYGRGCIHGTIFGIAIDSCQSGNLGSYLHYNLSVCYPAGITEVAQGVDLNIYPNPNQGNFTVTVASANRVNGTLTVIDQLGRVLKTLNIDVTGTSQIPLNMGNIAAGVYLLEVSTAEGRSVKQFIVR